MVGSREAAMRGAAALVLGAVALSWVGGCSWLFVTPVRSGKSLTPNPACTDSAAAPVLDLIAASLQTVNACLALSSSNQVTQMQGSFSLGFAAMYVSSAVYGFRNTSECTDLRRDDTIDDRSERPQPPRQSVGPHGFLLPPSEPPPGPPPFERPPLAAYPTSAPPDAGVAVAPPVPAAPPVPQKTDDE
jgi:hypothetical protein